MSGRLFTSAMISGRISSIIPRSSTVMPLRSRSRQSGSVKISWSERHARREVRLQHRSGEPGRVPRDELAALEPRGDDVHHAVGAAEHADHVHDLGQPADLVPGEHLGDLGP